MFDLHRWPQQRCSHSSPMWKEPFVCYTHFHHSLRLSSHEIDPHQVIRGRSPHKPSSGEHSCYNDTQRSALKQDVHMELWNTLRERSLIGAVRLESDHGWERDINVLVFLYWLAHAASYRAVSQIFDIPKISVYFAQSRVSKAVLGILRRVICFPTGDDMEAVGAEFVQLSGSPAFSKTVGAIDDCHIRIKPAANNNHCYYNRKLYRSIQLQAITDHWGKFIDIFVRYPGSVHDTRVLRNSPVYIGSLYLSTGKYILRDRGYPRLSAPICLITPYR
ncbi:hypothetical protein QQF64_023564 [Cirrhinus molitorella]|uniref:DDE Tnp4 domain-containing protein n=1 Tax=Cirrhinus molitorella TaxID=172907 RepID=A0ABR3NJM9_9TELE